jgi:hypothetical protein
LVPASTNNGVLRGAWFTDVNGKKKILNGQVVVSKKDENQMFTCRLIDETGRIIDVNYTH